MVYCTLGSGQQFGWTFPGDHLASQLPHHISRLTCQQELLVQDPLGAMEICAKKRGQTCVEGEKVSYREGTCKN